MVWVNWVYRSMTVQAHGVRWMDVKKALASLPCNLSKRFCQTYTESIVTELWFQFRRYQFRVLDLPLPYKRFTRDSSACMLKHVATSNGPTLTNKGSLTDIAATVPTTETRKSCDVSCRH